MNFQSMSLEAHKAIEDFTRSHKGLLHLFIKGGHVHAIEFKPRKNSPATLLDVPFWYQTHGFTYAEWNELITELLNLYNKEKSCQNQRKLLAPPNKSNS